MTRLCLVGLIVLGACAKPKPVPPAPTPTCVTTGQICGTVNGSVCGVCPNDGVCAPNGLSCIPALPISSPCVTDIECGENRECLLPSNGYQTPNGYCTTPCSATQTCPSQSTCGVDSKGDSVCLATCEVDGGPSCRMSDGYSCSSSNTCAACVADCSGKTCGDDGCGGTCGMTMAGVPACNTPSQVCSSGACKAAFVPQTVSMSPYAQYGLWDAAAFTYNGLALIVGGREVINYPAPNPTPESAAINGVYEYDPVNLTFKDWPVPMPKAVARPNAVLFNGSTLYVVGGTSSPEVPSTPDGIMSDLMMFDAANDNWKDSESNPSNPLIAPIPEPSMGGGAVGLGNFIYLLPGLTCPTGSTCVNLSDYTPSSSLHAYNPNSNTWDASPSPSRPSARSFMAVVTDGNRIYAIGGSDGTNALGTVEIFNPSSGWTTTQSLVVPVADPKAAISSGYIYIFGGREGEFSGSNPIPYVQSINLSTHATALLGVTYQSLIDQTPVQLQPPGPAPFLLFGAQEFSPGTTTPMADSDVLLFNVPAQ